MCLCWGWNLPSMPKVSSVWPPRVITNLQPNSFDLCRLRRYVRWKMKTMLGHELVSCVSCIFGLDDGDEDRWSWLIKYLRRILMKTEPLPNRECSSRFCFRFLLLSVDLPLLLHFFFRFSSSVFCYCWEMVLSCHVVGSMGDGKERLDLVSVVFLTRFCLEFSAELSSEWNSEGKVAWSWLWFFMVCWKLKAEELRWLLWLYRVCCDFGDGREVEDECGNERERASERRRLDFIDFPKSSLLLFG